MNPPESKNPLNLLGHALRATLRAGYGLGDLRADALAGIVTGIVALPLSMALGIATGVPPEHGLYTAIVAGVVASLFGGMPLQVTGPTAAFVVLLVPVTSRYGLGGLAIASVMAGLMLVAMAVLRLGKLVRFVPHPVTLGFTGGIGIVIATLQLKDFLGLRIAHMPEHYLGKATTILGALPSISAGDTLIGLATLGTLLVLPRLTTRVPPALPALAIAAAGAYLLPTLVPGLHAITIMDRFSFVVDGVRQAGIPRLPPIPSLDWFSQGIDGARLEITPAFVMALLPNAVAIALLAAIESLLAAVVADGMSGRRHHSDAELLGCGLANVAAPFFGGFAATGAIARTATNIRAGARSPFASIIHAGFVLLAILALAPALGYVPMAALAALLLQVAWKMSDVRSLVRAWRTSPREDQLVLVASLFLTVVFDMVVSVTAGVVLSMLLFSRRMAAQAQSESTGAGFDDPLPAAGSSAAVVAGADVPAGVAVHAVQGPLFFGDAERVMEPLHALSSDTRAVVVDLTEVSMLDASGIASLETAVAALSRQEVPVYLVAPTGAEPQAALARANLPEHLARLTSSPDRATALADLAAGASGQLH